MVVPPILEPVEDAKRPHAQPLARFADLLLAFPGGVELERDPTPLREFECEPSIGRDIPAPLPRCRA